MENGRDDTNTPEANAVVRVGGGTGVLLAPHLVLTAAHVVTGDRRGVPHEDAVPLWDDWQVPGWWYPLVRTTSDIDVSIGNARSTWETIKATHYSLPGSADMMMLRLERDVLPSEAMPVGVLVSAAELGHDYLRDKTLQMTGWGLTSASAGLTQTRQVGTGRLRDFNEEKFFVEGNAGEIIRGGDSGGPLIWQASPTRSVVVGIVQGTEGFGGRYYATFRKAVLNKPSVSWWLQQLVPSAVYAPDVLSDAPAGTVPLVSWWSPGRSDNLVTGAAGWGGGPGSRRSPDYRYVHHEGYLFHPHLPQPDGTVPLHSWFDPTRGDNFATTHPSWQHWEGDGGERSPGYRFVRNEGFVFDPRYAQPPHTLPLYSWYSRFRGDNWTTTSQPEAGANRRSLGPDYSFVRLEGYLPTSDRA